MHLSATAVDNVRGVLATAHAFVKPGVAERDIWKAYREAYGARAVRAHRQGARRPLSLSRSRRFSSGSNYADVGFELDPATGRVVALCAIDNLMKGAAGTAVQCANLMMGWDETAGLGVPGAASDLMRRRRLDEYGLRARSTRRLTSPETRASSLVQAL